jgi:hypothetical protein
MENEPDSLNPGDLCSVINLLAAQNELGQLTKETELKPPEETDGNPRKEPFQASISTLELKAVRLRCDVPLD